MLCFTNSRFIQFGQSINKIIALGCQPIVLREIYNLQSSRDIMTFHKFSRLAMTRTDKQTIYSIKGKLVGERQIGITIKTFVNIGNGTACMTRAIDKHNLYIGMIHQQPQQLAGSVTCATYDSYLNHKISSL